LKHIEYLCRTVQRSQYLSFPIVFSSFVYYLHQCYLQNLPYSVNILESLNIPVGRINKVVSKIIMVVDC
jgi:hypothetical protein